MLRWFDVMRTAVRSLLTRRAFDEQLDADIRFHLEEATAEYMRAGLSPDEARRAALRAFGSPVLVVEDVRETSMWIWWERLAQDLRFACRRLAKQKAFLFTTVPTLALCIGANTAIFSVVNSVILRPLAVPEPQRVVTMWNAYPKATGTDAIGRNGPPDFFDRRALTDVFESVAAYDGEVAYNVGGPREARRIEGVQATPSLFPLLRARAMLGRTFTEAEGEPGQDQVVLLSDGLWQELFGGDPTAIGRDLRLDGRPHTIVGVMPTEIASFPLRSQEPRLWTPLAFTPEQRERYHLNNRWNMLARLQPGVTRAQAQARIDALNQRNMDRTPDLKPLLLDAGFHTPVRVFQEELPGVERVGITNYIPFSGDYSRQAIFPEGHVPRPGESVVSPSQSVVTPGYFESMDIRIIEGRGFDDHDITEARPVIVIDRRLARRFWPDGDAIGRRMWRPPTADAVRDPSRAPHFDVVGIVESVQMRGVANPADQIGAYYFPLAQRMDDDVAFAIRTAGEPDGLVEPIRRAIAEIDPELPIFDIRSMEERIGRSLSDRRTPMVLTLGFGLLALLLAVIGIYGVLASLVQQRTREIGIRMALGSDGTAIFRLVLREGAVMIGLGSLAGFAGIVAMRRAIESQLHAISPLDPGVLAIAIPLMVGAAVAACLVAARRATRVDPVSALAEG